MSCLLGSSSKVSSDGEKRERSREKRHVERRTLLRQEQTYQRFLSAASIHIGMVKEHISSGPPCTAMQVVPAQGHEQGLKSSPSSPCHALPPGEEDCICPVWCNLKWQPCIKMIFKPVSPMEGQEHVDTSPGAQSPSTLRNVTRDLLHSTSTVYSGRCHISHSPDIWAYFGGGRRQRAGGCSWGKNFTAVIKLFSITGLPEQSLYWKLLCVLIYRSE